jgi:hypothetical protein
LFESDEDDPVDCDDKDEDVYNAAFIEATGEVGFNISPLDG